MLKDYLLDVMQQHEHSLYMCELPTGNGKTYDSARVIYALSDFLIMILSWLVKQSLRAFLFQEVQP